MITLRNSRCTASFVVEAKDDTYCSCTGYFIRSRNKKKKKLAASSLLQEAKIAYYAFDVIVYCIYTHQTRIAYTKRTH